MNHDQFKTALKALHAPLARQKARTNAIGQRYGSHSKEYQAEFRKEVNITQSITFKEWEIWCEYCIFLFTESAKQKGKQLVLAEIAEMGKHMEEWKKPGWRNVYTKIKSHE